MVREIYRSEIKSFIDFSDKLYTDDQNYVPLLRSSTVKMLRKLIFEKASYKALCSFDDGGHINGRILLTVAKNKQLGCDNCGYFSFFDVVNDQKVFNEFMDASVDALHLMGAEYIVGSFFPHDPDNKRGILIKGFELPPMIFTSHNPPYYQALFENYGFEKLTDAFEYEYAEKEDVIRKIKETAEKAVAEYDFHISKLDFSHIDSEIKDVRSIMESSSTQINFETVLSEDELKKILKKWKTFINPDYAFIARRNSDGKPIGFTLSIPDYFELIRKMKGRTDLRGLIVFLFGRKRITGLRAVLQYIIPEYQHKGISKALYYETKKSVDKNGVKRISLGTIMEKNMNSNGAIISLGGELSRIYRIYFKKI